MAKSFPISGKGLTLTGNYIMLQGHKVRKTPRTLSISLRLAKIWANLIPFALLRARYIPYLGVHKREFTNHSLYRPCHRPTELFFREFKRLCHCLCLSLLTSSGEDFTRVKGILNQNLKWTWKGPYPDGPPPCLWQWRPWVSPRRLTKPEGNDRWSGHQWASNPPKTHLF